MMGSFFGIIVLVVIVVMIIRLVGFFANRNAGGAGSSDGGNRPHPNLKQCPGCGAPLDVTLDACPHCGLRISV